VSTRRGFTLVEVLVALVVTSTVLLVGYSTLAASADARERVVADVGGGAREAQAVGLLRDALRHLTEAEVVDEPPLRVVPSLAGGAPQDSLILLTRGFAESLGTGRIWRVVLTADSAGVVLRARPLLGGDEPPIQLPPVLTTRLAARGVEVRVLALPASDEWRDRWAEPVARPAAVAITFTPATGQAAAPVIVRLGAPGAA
jgi:prepilin-type N-terminal cleavage/methylation domain-containing protein